MMTLNKVAVSIPSNEEMDWATVSRLGMLIRDEKHFAELWKETELKWAVGEKGLGLFAYAGVVEARYVRRGFFIWLVPAAGFDTHPVRAIRAANGWLDRLSERYGKSLWCYIDSAYPERIRLAKLLKFKHLGWEFAYENSIHHIYEREF